MTAKKLWTTIAPKTSADLQKSIHLMDPELVVFKFEFGNLQGMCSWKRKESWKQWCKQNKERLAKELEKD